MRKSAWKERIVISSKIALKGNFNILQWSTHSRGRESQGSPEAVAFSFSLDQGKNTVEEDSSKNVGGERT